MARKRTTKRRTVGGKRGYKKCIVNTMKRTKFTTPKSARRAFTRAAKKCRKLLTIRRAAQRTTRSRKGTKRRRTTKARRRPAHSH